jgi:hypothetical protein
MQISFLADPAFTRKQARLIYQQFFPLYLRSVWLRWLLFLAMLFALVEIIGFLRADDQGDWVRSWGLPDSFSYWLYGPLAFIVALLVLILLAELVVRNLSRKAERQFNAIAPPERADFILSDSDLTMKSESAHFTVPLAKITGLALGKDALAIGFSASGMIIPRSAFAGETNETAFLRAIASGMSAEALQRSSEAVRKCL